MEETLKPYEDQKKEVLEQLVEESTKIVLLDLAQDTAIKLASTLGDVRHALEFDDPDENVGTILLKVARMEVLLDALQLLYGSAAEEKTDFLKEIGSVME